MVPRVPKLVLATVSPITALINVDLPTPELPNTSTLPLIAFSVLSVVFARTSITLPLSYAMTPS